MGTVSKFVDDLLLILLGLALVLLALAAALKLLALAARAARRWTRGRRPR